MTSEPNQPNYLAPHGDAAVLTAERMSAQVGFTMSGIMAGGADTANPGAEGGLGSSNRHQVRWLAWGTSWRTCSSGLRHLKAMQPFYPPATLSRGRCLRHRKTFCRAWRGRLRNVLLLRL